MASPTKRTQTVRRRKLSSRGAAAKKQRQNKGSTPKFPIHKTPEGKSGK
jgi:hypothetical protein